MEFRKVELPYSNSEWVKVIPIGDVHLGNSSADITKLKAIIDYVKNKENTYWVGMGDYIEAINYSDPRFDPKSVDAKYLVGGDIDKIVQLQIKDIVELFRPIKDKCLGLLRGNHEETIRKYYHFDVLYEMAKDLDLDRDLLLYDTAIVRLLFKQGFFEKSKHSRQIDMLVSHGNAGGRTYGYKSNRLAELTKWFVADIYLLAHSHTKQTQSSTQIRFDRYGNQKKKKTIYAITGCFLKSYVVGKNSYAEKLCLPPSDIGVVKIMIQPKTGDLHISL